MAEKDKYELEIEGTSIVVLGKFIPTIFQPLWLSTKELIRKEEAEEAKINLIHSDITQFSTGWFSLQVLPGRFQLVTQDPTMHLPLRDLASGIFQLFENNPVKAFGFNSHSHYRIFSEEEWNLFASHYASKEPWLQVMEHPEMLSLTFKGRRKNCKANHIQIALGPSLNIRPGVYISINEHYDLDEEDLKEGNENKVLLESLQDCWEDFLSYRQHTSENLLKNCKSKNGD